MKPLHPRCDSIFTHTIGVHYSIASRRQVISLVGLVLPWMDGMKPRLWPRTLHRPVGSFSSGYWRRYSSLLTYRPQTRTGGEACAAVALWLVFVHSRESISKTHPFLLASIAPSRIFFMLSCPSLSGLKNFPALGHVRAHSVFLHRIRLPIDCLFHFRVSGCKCHSLSVPLAWLMFPN